jgi:hypothetical protein
MAMPSTSTSTSTSTGSTSSDDDEDEVTLQSGEELMFGLDFSKLGVSDIPDEEGEKRKRVACAQEVSTAATYYDPSLVNELLQLQETLPVATQADFSQLFDWATKEGAQLDGIACQQDAYGERGVYSTGVVTKGSILAILPRSLRIGQSYACKTLNLPKDTPDLSALSLLVVWFCREEHIYVKCLPRKTKCSNSLLMSKEQKRAWAEQGAEYASAIERVQSRGEACHQYISQCLSSNNNNNNIPANVSTTLLWAISMVKSRSHAFRSKRGYWLTPIFDLANHSPQPNAMLEGDAHGRLVLKAVKAIDKGQEITIDYQVEDDAMLVANYGFSLLSSI